MSCKGDTGQGATLGLSVTEAVGRIRSMQLPEWAMEKIDMSALDSVDWRCYTPGDITDPGDLTAEAIFDTELTPPTPGTIEDATVTFPLQIDTNAIPATLIGSGFITNTGLPNMAIGELMVQSITFAYDGNVTPPTYTPEAISIEVLETKLKAVETERQKRLTAMRQRSSQNRPGAPRKPAPSA